MSDILDRIKAECKRLYDTSPQPCADCPLGECFCPYSNEPMHWDTAAIRAALTAPADGCEKCGGNGYVWEHVNDMEMERVTCDTCNGTGRTPKEGDTA